MRAREDAAADAAGTPPDLPRYAHLAHFTFFLHHISFS
jgi:hypothetical protein